MTGEEELTNAQNDPDNPPITPEVRERAQGKGEHTDPAGEGADKERAAIPPEISDLAARHRWSLARAWREHKGMTREEVAGRMGISPAAVAQMEAASAKPRLATLRKIAAALEVEAEQLRS